MWCKELTKNVIKRTIFVILRVLSWPVTRDLGGRKMAKRKTVQQLEAEAKKVEAEIKLLKLKKEKEKLSK